MPKHNYSQYSNNNSNKKYEKNNTSDVFVGFRNPEIVVDDSANVVDAVVTPVVEPAPEVKMEPKKRKAVVANCTKLNVRENPDIHAEVVCVLPVDTEVEIDDRKSNAEWLNVYTVNGVEGYCMRKFMTVRR